MLMAGIVVAWEEACQFQDPRCIRRLRRLHRFYFQMSKASSVDMNEICVICVICGYVWDLRYRFCRPLAHRCIYPLAFE